ncbi:MAG: hypothetical protein FH756_01605 [Firmicutes bacterium]|nr:hypothetical protein [Bacillota bacterium]
MDWSIIWTVIKTSVLPSFFAIITFCVIHKFKTKDDIKNHMRLMLFDINKIRENLKNHRKNKSIPIYKINILPDWRNTFYIINHKLQPLEAEKILNFYFELERLLIVIEQYKKQQDLNKFFPVFLFGSEKILEIDLKDVLKKLENKS